VVKMKTGAVHAHWALGIDLRSTARRDRTNVAILALRMLYYAMHFP